MTNDKLAILYKVYEFAFDLNRHDKMLARNIMREVLFKRVKAVWSGMISKKALEAHALGKRPTREHYIPINTGVIHLLDRDEIASAEYFQDAVRDLSGVHWTTSEENYALKRFYKEISFERAKIGWAECYQQAGVELVQHKRQSPQRRSTGIP